MGSSESITEKAVDTEEPEGPRESDASSILADQRKANLAREGLYSFLARSFKYEADSEFLTMVAAVQPVLERLASAQPGAELKKASELLSTVSGKAAALEGKERKKMVSDAGVEYCSLFLNPAQQVGRERVWPWESAYFTDPPRMHGQPYHEVVEAFKMVGFEKPKEYVEPEDHMSLELEFMAHLTRLTTASIDNGQLDFALGYLKLQKEFLADHLLRWVGKFSQRLMQNSAKRETDFYYALGMMLESFIKLDDQTLDHMAAQITEISGRQKEAQASSESRLEKQKTQAGQEESESAEEQFCTIRGRVTYARGSVPLAEVKLARPPSSATPVAAPTSPTAPTIENSAEPQTATTDVAGAYVLSNLEPGTYELTVTPPKAWNYAAKPQTVELVAGEVKIADFTLERVPLETILEGRVFDSDGQPAKGARLEDVICNNKLESKITDPEGRFIFKNVTPGERFIRVNFLGHLSESRNFTIEEGQKVTIDFTLKKATHKIRGSVTDQEGKPVEALVQLFQGGPFASSVVQKIQTTKADGRYEFDVEKGEYSVLVQAEGYELAPWAGSISKDKKIDFQLTTIDPRRHTLHPSMSAVEAHERGYWE